MQSNVDCPQCGGRLNPVGQGPDEYECVDCGRVLRQVVVANIDAFKREAQRDTPTSEIAQAALEGVRRE